MDIKTISIKSGEMAEYLSSEVTKNSDGTYKVVHHFLSENFGKIKVTYPRVKMVIDATIEMVYPYRSPNAFPFNTEVLQKSEEDRELFGLEIEE